MVRIQSSRLMKDDKQEPDLELAVTPGTDQAEVEAAIQEAFDKTMEEMAPLLEAFDMEPFELEINFEED